MLFRSNAGWKELPLCAGSGRMLAQSAGTKDTFYLFGGVALNPGAKGVEREFLSDCHAFTLGKEWRRLAAGNPALLSQINTELGLIDGKLQDQVDVQSGPLGSRPVDISASGHIRNSYLDKRTYSFSTRPRLLTVRPLNNLEWASCF